MFVRTRLLPWITFGFVGAIALWPLVLVHPRKKLTPRLVRHERIHLRQLVEMLVVAFYLWYLIEALCKIATQRSLFLGYLAISFEREAYAHEHERGYLRRRRPWSWRHHLLQRDGKVVVVRGGRD